MADLATISHPAGHPATRSASVGPARDRRAGVLRGRRRRPGTAGRLAIYQAILLACVLSAVVVALTRSFTASYQSAAGTDLGVQIRQFEYGASTRPRGEGLRAYCVRFLETHPLAPGDAVVIALTGSGLVETGSSDRLVGDPTIARWFATPPASTQVLSATIGGAPLEVVAAPIRSGSVSVGTYVAARDLAAFAAQRSRVLNLSLAEAAVALFAGVAGAFLLLRRLLRKVGEMTEAAEEIGSGALDQRVGDQDSTDEVGELGRTFDAMLDRLEAAMTAQRRLLADVSHQLRTPLTVVRGHLEVLDRVTPPGEGALHDTLALVIDELDHMALLIERLLMLGRAMEPELLVPSPVNVPELLMAMIDSVAVLAPRRYVVPVMPSFEVLADREQLRGALVNLLDNAVHATSTDGIVAVGSVRDPAGVIRLVVEDSGPGIPAAQRDAVLQRFARPGARDADGSGLGLAIAKAVALAHGGAIEIDQSPTLGGARVAIVLPAARLVGVG